jgi:hypothetical protein
MSQWLKRGDDRIQAGYFDQPCNFYVVTQTKDTVGGEIRTPRPDNLGDAVPNFTAWANVQQVIGKIDDLDAERIISETIWLVSVRYGKSRMPMLVEGTLCQIKLTGQVLEVRVVDHLNFNRKKVELTCRLIV